MPKPETEVVTALAPVKQNSLINAPSFNAGFNAEDFRVPRLNCIQKMSEIAGTPGDVVLDRRATILKPGNKLPVTVVSIRKSWIEKVPYDDEYTPRVARTPEEKAELEATSSRQIVPRADIVVLLPHDPSSGIDEEEAAELFPFLIGDTAYQLGMLTVQSFAYDYTFKILNSFHVGNPGKKLQEQTWNLSSTLLERGKYSWYVPTLGRSTTPTSPEVLDFVDRLLNGGDE
jgi:hypothetical protein